MYVDIYIRTYTHTYIENTRIYMIITWLYLFLYIYRAAASRAASAGVC